MSASPELRDELRAVWGTINEALTDATSAKIRAERAARSLSQLRDHIAGKRVQAAIDAGNAHVVTQEAAALADSVSAPEAGQEEA